MKKRYVNKELAECDEVLMQALASIGLITLDSANGKAHLAKATSKLRELADHLEEGNIPFPGSAKIATEMVDHFIENLENAKEIREREQQFFKMFDAGVPRLQLVPEPEDGR